MAITTTSPSHDTAALDRELVDVLGLRQIRAVFQPVVRLDTREVVGLEALARGPRGTAMESPRELFAAARRLDRVAELDWACRAAAFGAFTAAHVPPSMSLFVNLEPEALGTACPADLAPSVARAEAVLRVFVEVNDRALATDPAGLLLAVDRARASGWGVALDDVGASRASLAVLPLVGADLVKLDLQRLRQRDAREASAITLSVLRLIEASGSALLVEGIETTEDVAWALSMGATFGQGYYFGAPAPLEESYPLPRAAVRLLRAEDAEADGPAPFDQVSDRAAVTMSSDHLEELLQTVYRASLIPGESPVVLGCNGAGPMPADQDLERYPEPLAPPLLLVHFGTGDDVGYPGVREVALPPTDPTAHETFLLVLSENDAVAVVARRSEVSSDLLDVILTQDPARVHRLARGLIRRIPPDHSA